MGDDVRPSLRAEQVAATRDALVRAGRATFGAHGFADTSVSDVARHAGVTTGALYHHFPTKAALFEVVFELLEVELNNRSTEAALQVDAPLDQLQRGFDAFLDAVLDPEIQRIVLVDAPAVLGPVRYQEIDERYAYAGLHDALRRARDDGSLASGDTATLAQLLLGALMHGAMLVARATTPRAARSTRRKVGDSLAELLAHLRA